ncbi:AbrB family transcriptional regulator, partial [Sinorhizobium meliloti]
IKVAGIDPLTAYLATSPGGLDSIAVIAASSNVDLPFVMALQTARLLIITLIGPALARFVADRA